MIVKKFRTFYFKSTAGFLYSYINFLHTRKSFNVCVYNNDNNVYDTKRLHNVKTIGSVFTVTRAHATRPHPSDVV